MSMNRSQWIHARIVHDVNRHLRQAAKKSGLVTRRNKRIARITKEIDAEWEKRKKAS